jgi:hypothetical protein
MVKDFINGALRREGLQSILNSIGLHLSPIKEDTESWACAKGVPRRYLDGGSVGSITGWSRKNFIGRGLSLGG